MQKIYLLGLMLLLVCSSDMNAQRIIRSTICSAGSSKTVNNLRVAATFGQKSVSCSVVSNGNNFLRQGFQQPIFDDGNNSTDCFQSSFAVENFATTCGTYYSFEYMGNVNTAQADFTWNFGQDAFPRTSSEANPMDIAYATIGTKIIFLQVTKDGCTDQLQMKIDVTETGFGVNPSNASKDCASVEETIVELMAAGGTEPYTFLWSDGGKGATRTGLALGDYSYTVTDAVGCEYSASITIDGEFVSGLVVEEEVTTASCQDTEDGGILLDVMGGIEPYSFEWSTGSSSNQLVNVPSETYSVTITDAEGCTFTASYTIGNFCNPDDIISSVFTPNGDNINDTWTIKGIERYPDNEVEIFNRWGSIVFSTRGYQNDWAGTNNEGKELVAAPYWYVVRLNDENDTMFSGSVTIIR